MAWTSSIAVISFFSTTTASVKAWISTISPFSKPLCSMMMLGITSFFFVVPLVNTNSDILFSFQLKSVICAVARRRSSMS